jgi:Ca2+/Na+ antiporter
VAASATLAVGAEASGALGTLGTGLALAALLLPYLAVSSLRPRSIACLPLPPAAVGWLAAALRSEERDEDLAEREGEADASTGRTMSAADGLSILPMLAVIVTTSIVMVKVAVLLGGRWGLPEIVVGLFVVATLTGLPNFVAAVRLASKGRGAALSSEAFNSNTLNLLAGIYGPSLLVAGPPVSRQGLLSIVWLIAITAAALALGVARGGFGRWTGGMLAAIYAGFVLSVLL